MLKKSFLIISISFALLQIAFCQNKNDIFFYLKPQKFYSISYNLNNFLPKSAFYTKSNLFIFGNLQPTNSSNYPAVFITKPYPTLKILADTGFIYINDAQALDSIIYIVGYAKINDSTKSYLAKIDELGNLQWDTIFNFPYPNKLCCLKIIDSTILAAGSFQDPNFIQNLQLLKISLNGQITSGKSIPVSVNFWPTKMIIDDHIFICANYSDQITNPVLFKFDKELNLIKIKKFKFQQNTSANDMVSTNSGLIIAGQKNNKPWTLALNQNLNIIRQKTFNQLAINEQFTQIQPFSRNFILSTIIPTSGQILSRVLAISPEGYIQWDLPTTYGIQLIITHKKSFKTLNFNGNQLTISSYRTKNNFIWHKTFAGDKSSKPLHLAFLKNKIIAITKNQNNNINLWAFTTNGLLTLHQTIKNITPTAIHNDKNFIYILSGNPITQKYSMTFIASNLSFSTYPVNLNNGKPLDFIPVQDGFIFITTSQKQLNLVKTSFKLQEIWKKHLQINTLSPKITKINNNLLLSFQPPDSQNTFNLLLINDYGHIKWSKKLNSQLSNPKLIFTQQLKNQNIIILSNNDSSIIYNLDQNYNVTWNMTLDFKTSNAQIINQKLLLTHGNKSYLYLTYINLQQHKILKTIQIPDIDGQNIKSTKTRFFYLLTNSYLTPTKSYILIKTR